MRDGGGGPHLLLATRCAAGAPARAQRRGPAFREPHRRRLPPDARRPRSDVPAGRARLDGRSRRPERRPRSRADRRLGHVDGPAPRHGHGRRLRGRPALRRRPERHGGGRRPALIRARCGSGGSGRRHDALRASPRHHAGNPEPATLLRRQPGEDRRLPERPGRGLPQRLRMAPAETPGAPRRAWPHRGVRPCPGPHGRTADPPVRAGAVRESAP